MLSPIFSGIGSHTAIVSIDVSAWLANAGTPPGRRGAVSCPPEIER